MLGREVTLWHDLFYGIKEKTKYPTMILPLTLYGLLNRKQTRSKSKSKRKIEIIFWSTQHYLKNDDLLQREIVHSSNRERKSMNCMKLIH